MTIRYIAADGLRAVDFSDEWVVFNPLSWDAHLLNPAAALVLDALKGEAHSEQDVESYLREVLVAPEQASAGRHARRLLEELMQLGLVRAVPGESAAHR